MGSSHQSGNARTFCIFCIVYTFTTKLDNFLFVDFNDVLKKLNELKALNMFAAKHYCERLLKEFSQIYSSSPSKVCTLCMYMYMYMYMYVCLHDN